MNEAQATLIAATLTERKAICRMLAFQSARAGYRYLKTPWWDFRTRWQMRWTLAALTTAIHQIEQGEHHNRQSEWMTDIETGEFLDRAINDAMRRDTDGSPAGRDAQRLDGEAATAGAEGIAQTSAAIIGERG